MEISLFHVIAKRAYLQLSCKLYSQKIGGPTVVLAAQVNPLLYTSQCNLNNYQGKNLSRTLLVNNLFI